MLRRQTILGMLVVVTLLATIGTVFADTSTGCTVNVPDGSKLVVNVKYAVINDEDYGWGNWYWALTNYEVKVKAWQLPDGSWLGFKTYQGSFYTPAGALSPYAGVEEPRDGSGVLHSCYTVTFTGTLDTSKQLKGDLGVQDFGGTVEDLLLGTGGSGAPGGFNWRTTYFPDSTNVVFQQDIFTYTLNGNGGATARKMVQTGVYSGIPTTTGDIITG